MGPGARAGGQAQTGLLAPVLVAHGHEPPAPAQEAGTLGDWESPAGAGVVHVDSHGAPLPVVVRGQTQKTGVLSSATRRSEAIDAERAAELRSGQLLH